MLIFDPFFYNKSKKKIFVKVVSFPIYKLSMFLNFCILYFDNKKWLLSFLYQAISNSK